MERNILVQVSLNLQLSKLHKIKKSKFSMMAMFHFSSIFFFYWKIQLEVLYNSIEANHWVLKIPIHFMTFLGEFVRGWSNFRIGIGLVKCQFKVKKAFRVQLVRNEMSTSFFHRIFMYSLFNT